jgi:hypothetical protein
MDTIYNNSYVTISAASAASASVGFLYPRPQLHLKPLRIPLRLQPKDKVATSIMYEYSQLARFEAEGNPVERRGWTLQEKLLSRRILVYSATHLQWGCRSIPLDPESSEVLQGSFLTNTQRLLHTSPDGAQDWGQKLELYQGLE